MIAFLSVLQISMALTPAEKQRRYRQKRDINLVRREEYLRKERERWQTQKSTGQVKSASSLSDRELRRARKCWRATKAAYRKRQKETANLVTPPMSPAQSPIYDVANKSKAKRSKNRQKLKNTISELTALLDKQKTKTSKYKKRWQREN